MDESEQPLISLEELESIIADGLAPFDDDVRAEWQRIRIEPALWHRRSRGTGGERCWVIAIEDGRALWFDDDHGGFSWNAIVSHGIVEDGGSWDIAFDSVPRQIARRQSEAAWARLVEGDVPDELRGPGTVVKTQALYWDVRVAAGEWRIYMRDAMEARCVEPAYPRMEMVAEHPLLAKYAASSRSLYFTGTSSDPSGCARAIEVVLRDGSDGWRGLRDFGSSVEDVERRLRSGFGMLLFAPTFACHAVESVLERHGVMASVIGRDVTYALPLYRVLLMGRSAIVAGGFAFERR